MIFNKKLVNANMKKADFSFDVMKKNFDKNVYEIIKSNPNIKFDIFFPPYSILAWYDIDEQGWLKDALLLRKYIQDKLNSLNNAYLYDFQANIDFITNLNNYVDTTHYKPKCIPHILDNISKKRISLDINKSNSKIKAYVKKLKNGFLKEFIR